MTEKQLQKLIDKMLKEARQALRDSEKMQKNLHETEKHFQSLNQKCNICPNRAFCPMAFSLTNCIIRIHHSKSIKGMIIPDPHSTWIDRLKGFLAESDISGRNYEVVTGHEYQLNTKSLLN
jgi:hypothetical protein